MYDLKTISGRASVRNRLLESIGQANQVILNMNTKYNPRLLAKDLMYYFHINPSAIEVIIFKGNQLFLVKRMATEDKEFVKKFRLSGFIRLVKLELIKNKVSPACT